MAEVNTVLVNKILAVGLFLTIIILFLMADP